MTAELVLLLAVYATLILGLFFHQDHGVVTTFENNLPKLSARIEKHVATGSGFWTTSVSGSAIKWAKPPN